MLVWKATVDMVHRITAGLINVSSEFFFFFSLLNI